MGFKMILSNLLSNAIIYSFEGQVVQLKIYKQDDHLYLEIKDQGVGMTAQPQQGIAGMEKERG